MKKSEFLKKWAKRASSGKSVEEFERDVEAVVADTIRLVTRGVARGIEQASSKLYLKDARLLMMIARTIVPSVEKSMMKLNGIQEEGGHGKGA